MRMAIVPLAGRWMQSGMYTGISVGVYTDVVDADSKKSVQRLKTKVRELLVPGNNAPWQDVRDTLNRSLRGWSNYFCHGTRRPAFRTYSPTGFTVRHTAGHVTAGVPGTALRVPHAARRMRTGGCRALPLCVV